MLFLPVLGARPCNSLDMVSQPFSFPPCSATLCGHSPRKIQDQPPPWLPCRVCIVLASKVPLPRNVRPCLLRYQNPVLAPAGGRGWNQLASPLAVGTTPRSSVP